jgi:copper chaperone CopZ
VYKTTVNVEGMMCEMCESHVNEAVVKAFPGVKAKSSHRLGRTEIWSEAPLPPKAVEAAISATGYSASGAVCAEAEKPCILRRIRSLFS